MSKLDEFIAALELEVNNHSIYVWSGQGQGYNIISEAWIRHVETSPSNASRAIVYWKKQCRAGYAKVLRAFDCSGLGVYHLVKLGIYNRDMTANSMMGKCAKISRSELKRGDWVFRVDSSGRAYHIGYVVDDKLKVIEAMGRDRGVVKRGLNASGTSYWNRCGRPSAFKAQIEEEKPAPKPIAGLKLVRLLKYVSPYMRGEDVKAVQRALIAQGFDVGKSGADGIFGQDTRNAVRRFQTAKGLTVDGIVGRNTIAKLGGKWTG